MMNNFVWVAIMLFRISGTSQAYFGSLKGCYQCRYYCRECLYSQISLKVWDSEEKLVFLSRLPLRRHIARWCTFSVDPGILVSLYASARHPYTTLATGGRIIFWPSEGSPVEVGPTECIAAILKSSHPYMSGCYQQPYNIVQQPRQLKWETVSWMPLLSKCRPGPWMTWTEDHDCITCSIHQKD